MKNLVALSTLLLVLLLLLLDTENTAPGPMASVHSQVAELRGREGCAVCHGEAERGMSDSCQACHAAIGDQLAERSGLHGRLESSLASDCARCHGEHLGESFVPVNEVSFSLAGIADREAFDHSHVDWTLAGTHGEQSCAACHVNADVELLPVGDTRFLGLAQACQTCHEDVHEGSFGASCADCHGQELAFDLVANFEHHPDYPLEGAHAAVACSECHEAASKFDVGTLLADSRGDRKLLNARESCKDCHDSLHGEPFLAAAALELKITGDQVCTSCHSPTHGSFRGDPAEMSVDLHATTGFPLGSNHAAVECAKCHDGFGDPAAGEDHFALAFPGRTSQSCGACHEDPHKGYYGNSCTDCHGLEAPFAEVANFEHHPDYPLIGGHAEVACIDCHEPGTAHGVRAVLGRGVPRTAPELLRDSCSDCHENPHSTAFTTGVAANLSLSIDQTCTTCHAVTHETFRGDSANLSAALHACAGFALEEPHTGLSCADCHVGFDSPAASDDYFARAFPGREPETCQACHEDPHSNQFAKGPFASGCLECHAQTRFVPPQFGVEHHARSSFPLDGAHTAVGCVSCHAAGPATVFADAPLACAECHDSPHEERFDREELPAAVDGREGCARCHTTASFNEFPAASFDHELWTEFALVGQHAATDCASCHQPIDDPVLGSRGFGPAPGTRCADCHQDIHLGQFDESERADCARCHEAASEVFRASLFDHATDSAFPLDAQHAGLSCSACHLAYDLPDGGRVTRYVPLGTECVDCHDPGRLNR